MNKVCFTEEAKREGLGACGTRPLTTRRVAFSIAFGAVGCLLIWVATPYNNFLLQNSYITDSYMPVAVVILMLALSLCVNALLRLTVPDWMLDRRQLALVFGMLLMATVVPGQGLLRVLPWSLTRSTQEINRSQELSGAIGASTVRKVLFPDPIGYEVATPVSDQWRDELAPGAAIPWDTWRSMGLIWGMFVLACWVMMVGIGLAMFPEWKENERLQFPLLDVYRSLLPASVGGRILPSIFTNRLFWNGACTVMLIYMFKGLHYHTHNRFPDFPLGWDLSYAFSEVPWRYLPRSVTRIPHIYFTLVGIAYFMPNRVGISLWFFPIAYALYEMLGMAYNPTYDRAVIFDHRSGAVAAMSLITLYISRRHWWRIGQLMFRRVTADRDRLLKMAGWMIVTGALVALAWLVWAGVPYGWALVFVFVGFMVSVTIARIVAETGIPFVAVDGLYTNYLLSLMPVRWLTGAAIYMAGYVSIIFHFGSRAGVSAMALHAAGIDEEATGRYQRRLGYFMIVVLVAGVVIGGAVHIHMAYHNAKNLAWGGALVSWGAERMVESERQLLDWARGTMGAKPGRLFNFLFAMIGFSLLRLACVYSPRWPLNPIGMLLLGTYYGRIAMASVFIGWALKASIIAYGGARAFRAVKPLFLGIIMGEVFSAVIWTLVPLIQMLLGHDPSAVGHITVLPM